MRPPRFAKPPLEARFSFRSRDKASAKQLDGWLHANLDELALRDRAYADQLRAFLAVEPPRDAADGIELVLTDREKTMATTQQACVHTLQHWIAARESSLREAIGDCVVVRDVEPVTGTFATCDQRIGRVKRRKDEVQFQLDGDALVSLPAADRVRLRKQWQSDTCSCAGCESEWPLVAPSSTCTHAVGDQAAHDALVTYTKTWWKRIGSQYDDDGFKRQPNPVTGVVHLNAREDLEKMSASKAKAPACCLDFVWNAIVLETWATR